jgi:cyclopropane-fatty-acyl-phospholipid synthase
MSARRRPRGGSEGVAPSPAAKPGRVGQDRVTGDLARYARGAVAARWAARALLRRLEGGRLSVVEGEREVTFGGEGPRARVVVHDRRAYGAVLWGGSAGLGASYAAGWWDCEDLTDLVRVLLRATSTPRAWADRLARALAPLRESAGRARTRTGSSRRLRTREMDRDLVSAHYDLSNDFFELMLDETMTYSCAFFQSPERTLAQAQRSKLDRICQKLGLQPDERVVEIGGGWGGFAVHAAERFGCRVTTTTLSQAQYEYAARRVAEAGLAERVEVLQRDYRDLEGTFDKLVSIEMIEAIDAGQLETFFATCSRLLTPDGLMGLQAIVIDDRSYEGARRREDFIKRYVFPGGFLPSIAAMTQAATRASDLRVIDLEDIGRHYVETLRRWRENLARAERSVASLELGTELERLWKMYLCYCEAGFFERHVSDVQVVLAREAWRDALGGPGRP